MTSYTLSPIGGAGWQFFDNSGNILSGGKLYTYAAGTTTPQTTWTTPAGITQNSNPIILNAAGRPANEIWLSVAYSYKFVIKDSDDVLIATYDNIPGLPQPAIVNDASSISYVQGNTVTAGLFVIGNTYRIASLGSTDFVSIGAAFNLTGQVFVATGVGSGTGTAYNLQTVQYKLAQTVSVKDFGAVGDGVTDDTAAFENAFAASDTVVVPANGTYIVKLADVPSNKTIIAYGAVLLNSDTGNTGIFSIAAGVSNVTLLGGSYRGPAYGGTPLPAPAYPVSNGCIRILGTYNNVCSDITIKDVEIAGWNDYGIFAENVLRGTFNNNHIHTIGRDGIRFYGAVLTDVSHNHIHDITPGFSGVAPNLNAYGITITRNPTNEGTPLVNHPPSSYCTANNNLIENIPTWKGLDTHGGQNITFADNVIRNCRFGIGVDEGNTSGVENAPPVNIVVNNNIMVLGTGNAGAAGINITSSSASNRGTGVVIEGNTISGFGGTSTGSINVAYNDYVKIIGNTIIDSAVCAINFPGSTTSVNALIDANIIHNLTSTPLAAIVVQSATIEGFIKGGTFSETNGVAYSAVSLGNPSSGYGFRISEDLSYYGNVTKWAPNALSRVVSGSVITQAKAYARVNSLGALSAANNIASVVKNATGEYTVTLLEGGLSSTSIVPVASTRATTAAFFINADAANGTTIKVYTYNLSGIANDCSFNLVVFGI